MNDQDQHAAGDSSCPLTRQQQTRNILLFGANTGMIYLGCAVFYVGITEAALCKELGADDKISNLPGSAYNFGTFLPVFIAWYFPFVRSLRPMVSVGFAMMALCGVGMASVLISPVPGWLAVAAVTAYAVLVGVAIQIVATFQWEILGRGVPESRRGEAFAWAFGAGPILAVIGSLASQLILTGTLEVPVVDSSFNVSTQQILKITPLAFPLNYAVLFGASAPIAGMAAIFTMLYVVPKPAVEIERQPFFAGVFGGLVEFFSYRTIRYAAIASILIFGANLIMGNVSLYTKQLIGADATQYVGYQNALRFGFKIFAGFALGWLLTRTSARAGLVATALICLAGVVWASVVPGKWFMVSFGLLGAGELYGNYYPNYILCCSPPSKMRRNMALSGMLPMISGPAAVLFGWISDNYDYVMSFQVAGAIMVLTILLVLATLPAHPRPRRQDMDASDLALAGTVSDEEPRLQRIHI